MEQYHNAVLLHAAVDGLNIQSSGTYVDVTFGGGGHSREILQRLGAAGQLIAFDQDADAWANAPADPRFQLVKHNFKYLHNYLRLMNAVPVAGILADLGVSSHQFDEGTRGFSIRFDGPLDMRMNQVAGPTAADVVNGYSREELVRVFRTYGEVPQPFRLAEAIAQKRITTPIKTTTQLRELVAQVERRGEKLLAQVFQALRIEVNNELEVLEKLLLQGLEVLQPGGRFVVISYHSLEDRLVKRFFKTGNFAGEAAYDNFYGHKITPFKEISRKAIVPTADEIAINPRARSAKMRIVEKL
jgi:16S rRNA (cytosine1402-N4)-methyltransferase